MNIRLLQIGFLSYLALVGFGGYAEIKPVPSSVPQKPNIVLIYADDLGYGDVGLYNATSKIPTPNIDDLGRRGVWLTDGHAASATCTPSRYALMTGRYAWRTRLTAGVLMPWGEPLLEEQEQTVGDLLKSVGYSTALVGKWHLGFHWPWRDGARPADAQILPSRWISEARNDQFDWSKPLLGGPTDAGFDYYFGDDVPNFPPYAWIENDQIVADGLVDLPRSALISIGYSGGIHGSGPGQLGWQLDQVMPTLVEKSVAYIQTQKNATQPFFLMVSLTSPHTPIVPTEEFDGTSQVGTYGDFVVQTDAAIGSVYAALVAAGLQDETLVIVTSDNGPEYTAYRQWRRYDHDSVAGLRGLKADTWEGGHRVPFVVSWPAGGIAGGKRLDGIVSQVDLFATIAAVVGVQPENRALDSINVLPTLRGQRAVGRETLIYHGLNGSLGIRQGAWVLLPEGGFGRSSDPRWAEPDWVRKQRGVLPTTLGAALYNLETDPGQTNNVISAHPGMAARLQSLLEQSR